MVVRRRQQEEAGPAGDVEKVRMIDIVEDKNYGL
jgi:hypothetical protein